MDINSDYSITRLFINKEIEVTVIDTYIKLNFKMVLRPVEDFFNDKDWNICYHLITGTSKDFKKVLPFVQEDLSPYNFIRKILFDFGRYDKYKSIYTIIVEQLQKIIPEIKITSSEFSLGDYIITEEIWDYILYILKLSNGEKVEKPLSFDSEEARKFYLAQKANEDKIKALRSQANKDQDGLIKMMLSITYSFPSFTIEYLWKQTMAQILWLRSYAAGAVSYEVNAQAFAAGNMKKGKKLDFFIK